MARSAASKAEQAAEALDAFLRDRPAAAIGADSGEASASSWEGEGALGDVGLPPRPRAEQASPAVAQPWTAGAPLRLPHTDWLFHRLAVTGPAAAMAAFSAAATGAGTISWRLDLDSFEEDWFHLLVNPAHRALSLGGARVLAGQLREAVEHRHAVAVARVGRSRACPLDLHALLPVPGDILHLGPDHPDAMAWLWQNWGITQALRHVAPDTAPQGTGSKARRGRGEIAVKLLGGGLDAVARLRAHPGRLAGPAVRPTAAVRRRLMDGSAPDASDQGVLALEDWEQPPRRQPGPAAAPVLAVNGFEGPLDWLLDLARTRRIDLARLSIVALVEAFEEALTAALAASDLRPTLLGRWGDWLVMAADLTLLRSRLLVPADAAAAQDAQDEAERLRQRLLGRAEIGRAADWLECRGQLGRDVFGRGQADGAGVVRAGRAGDITGLLRACLVAIRLPAEAGSLYQVPGPPFWSVADAAARIRAMLPLFGEAGAGLGAFLPEVPKDAPERELRCRVAVAATFLAGLEFARDGTLALDQEAFWVPIQVQQCDLLDAGEVVVESGQACAI